MTTKWRSRRGSVGQATSGSIRALNPRPRSLRNCRPPPRILHSAVFRALALADGERFGRALALEDWSWTPAFPMWANHYGSGALMMAEAAAPFERLASRLAPWCLLEAARVRGADPTGEDLVTLKARSNLGVLPSVSESDIPEAHRPRVLQAIEALVDTAYRAGPESVIDRCRDMSAAVLGAFFELSEPGSVHKDLGELAKIAARQQRFVIEQTARLVSLLHARVKPNEQRKRNMRSPHEEDATLALECAGAILREVGWSK
jgi:hypothetical protein